MEEISEEVTIQSKVKNLVFAYEQQSSYTGSAEENGFRPRAKSIGNALSYKFFRDPNMEIHSLLDIEKEVVKIDAHLNYYEYYDKETHVAFQEQLFEILKGLVSIDPEGCEVTIQKKKELIRETQRLSKILNSKLPFDSTRSYRGVRRTYNTAKKDDSTVSTTTKLEHHQITQSLSSQASNTSLNKSQESLSSLKDSVDSSRLDDNINYASNHSETKMDTTIQSQSENEEEIPKPKSVSRLTRFFSFRSETKPEVKIISSAYSGVSRSSTFNAKSSSKYQTYKNYKNQKTITSEENLNETEEDVAEVNEAITSSEDLSRNNSSFEHGIQEQSSFDEVYVEHAGSIEEYKGEEEQTSVSVSKLKSFFEERHEEDKEGNYLNYGGVLRSTDISKKSDLNKSKSTSDLLGDSSRFDHDNESIDGDLNINLDNDVIEPREVSRSNGFLEINNNENQEDHLKKEETEVVYSVSGQVRSLKNTFEKMSSVNSEHEEIEKVLHRTINPKDVNHEHDDNSGVQITNFNSEPLLKVPIQLRVGGFGNPDAEEQQAEKQADESEEPTLKVPVQARISNFEAQAIPVPLEESTEQKQTDEIKKIPALTLSPEIDIEQQYDVLNDSHENVSLLKTRVEKNEIKEEIVTETSLKEVTVVEESRKTNELTGQQTVTKKTVSSQQFEQTTTDNVAHTEITEAVNNNTTIKKVKEPTLTVPIELRLAVQNNESIEQQAPIHEETVSQQEVSDIFEQQTNDEVILKVPIQTRSPIIPLEGQSRVLTEDFQDKESVVSQSVEHISHKVFENTDAEKIVSGSSVLEETKETAIPSKIIETSIDNIVENNNDKFDKSISDELKEVTSTESLLTGIQESIEIVKIIKSETSATDSKTRSTQEYVTVGGSETTEQQELKVPNQLRVGLDNSETLTEITSESEKQHEHEDLILKVPAQLGVGTATSTEYNEENVLIENIKKEGVTYSETIIIAESTYGSQQEQVTETHEEPTLVPIQLRVGVISSQTSDRTETTSKSNKDTTDETKEINLKVPTELPVGLSYPETITITESTSRGFQEQVKIVDQGEKYEEPKLKVPVQLQVGVLSSDISANTEASSENNEKSEELKLKVSEDLRAGVTYSEIITTAESTSEGYQGQVTAVERNEIYKEPKLREDVVSSETLATIQEHVVTVEQNEIHKEPKLKVPVRLRVGLLSSETSAETETSFESNDESKLIEKSEELKLNVPTELQLGTTYSKTITTGGTSEDFQEQVTTVEQDEEHESKLKVPVQLRVKEVISETSVQKETGSENNEKSTLIKEIEKLKFPTELPVGVTYSETNSTTESTTEGSQEHVTVVDQDATHEEPILKVPIQLRVNSSETSIQTQEPVIIVEQNETHKEPILKVPIQLRVGVVSSETSVQTETSSANNEVNTVTDKIEEVQLTESRVGSTYSETITTENTSERLQERVSTFEGEEQKLNVPVQLRVGVVSSDISVATETSSGSNKKTEELKLIVPEELRAGITYSETITTTESTSEGPQNQVTVVEQNEIHEKPKLKVPVQLRVGLSSSETSAQTETSFESNHESKLNVSSKLRVGVTYSETITTTENTTKGSQEQDIVVDQDATHEEPILKVPVQLRVGENSSETLLQTQEQVITVEPNEIHEEATINVPIQLRVGVVSSETSAQTETSFENNHGSKLIEESEELKLNVPTELRVGVTYSETITTNENTTEGSQEQVTVVDQDASHEEPILKVPVQLRVGVNHSETSVQTQEQVTTVEQNEIHEEPIIKVPIQLRVEVLSSETSAQTEISSTNNEGSTIIEKTEEEQLKVPTVSRVNSTYSETITTTENMSEGLQEQVSIFEREEQKLKVPVQLRAGVISSNIVTTAETSSESIQKNVITEETEELKLKLPTEPRVGVIYSDAITTGSAGTNQEHIIVKESKEPKFKLPVHLQIGSVSSGISETTDTEYFASSASKSRNFKIINEETEEIEVPRQLRVTSSETITTESTLGNSEKIVATEENAKSELKLPVQLRLGVETIRTESSGEISQEIVEKNEEQNIKIPIQLKVIKPYSETVEKKMISHNYSENQVKSEISETSTQSSSITVSEKSSSTKAVITQYSEKHSEDNQVTQIISDQISTLDANVPLGFKDVRTSQELQQSNRVSTSTVTTQEGGRRVSKVQQVRVTSTSGGSLNVSGSQEILNQTLVRTPVQLRLNDVNLSQDEIETELVATDSRFQSEEPTFSGSAVQIHRTISSGNIVQNEQKLKRVDNDNGNVTMNILQNSALFSTLKSTPVVSQKIISPSSGNLKIQDFQSSPTSISISEFNPDELNPNSSSDRTEVSTVTSSGAQGSIRITKTTQTKKKSTISLNESQENIIDQILNDSDDIDDLDEEFEKLVQENI